MTFPLTRIVLDIALLVSILLLPWWVSFFIAIYLGVRYTAYEIVLAGFLLDSLYGVSSSVFFGIPMPLEIGGYALTLLFGLLFLISVVLKRFLIVYEYA